MGARLRRDPPGSDLEQGRCAALENEERGAVRAVGRALRELASASPVLVDADRGVRALAATADQVLYLYGAVPPAAPRRDRPARRTPAADGG